MFVTIKELASVHLGYKSLQNEFFYVSQATVDTYGIESHYLKPILMLADLAPTKFLQAPKPKTWLFYCHDKLADLRGTGARRYIDSMADRDAAQKKQSAAAVPTIREVLEAQGGGHWYGPKAVPHERHVWIRKAYGGVFAPFLFDTAQVMDQRLNSVSPREGVEVNWQELGAVLTLTSTAYSLEINGAASMGAGALEAPTTKIRDYPVFDVRSLSKPDRKELVRLAKEVWNQEPPVDWSKERFTIGPKLRALDEWVLAKMGSRVKADRIYEDLHEACQARYGLAKDKVKKVNKKKTDNIGNVAGSICAALAARIKGKNFPEDFLQLADLDLTCNISREAVKSIETETFFDEVQLTVRGDSGKKLLDESYKRPQAEAIVRALLWGRSSFQLTTNESKMNRALAEFTAWTAEIDAAVDQAISESALGTGYEERLRSEVLTRLGIHPLVLIASLPASISVK